MLVNIVDRRKNIYVYDKVNAVIEPTRNDNDVINAIVTKTPGNAKMDKLWLGYDEREHISINLAVKWASAHKDAVTLFLYDKDDGIYIVRQGRRPSKK